MGGILSIVTHQQSRQIGKKEIRRGSTCPILLKRTQRGHAHFCKKKRRGRSSKGEDQTKKGGGYYLEEKKGERGSISGGKNQEFGFLSNSKNENSVKKQDSDKEEKTAAKICLRPRRSGDERLRGIARAFTSSVHRTELCSFFRDQRGVRKKKQSESSNACNQMGRRKRGAKSAAKKNHTKKKRRNQRGVKVTRPWHNGPRLCKEIGSP